MVHVTEFLNGFPQASVVCLPPVHISISRCLRALFVVLKSAPFPVQWTPVRSGIRMERLDIIIITGTVWIDESSTRVDALLRRVSLE